MSLPYADRSILMKGKCSVEFFQRAEEMGGGGGYKLGLKSHENRKLDGPRRLAQHFGVVHAVHTEEE